jgi:hypothetical protein
MSQDKPPKLVMRKLSEIRQFSEAEAQKVIDYTRTNHPDLWDEIVRIETTTGDFTMWDPEDPEARIPMEASNAERRILLKMHPECDPVERTNLGFAVRALRRKQLGLK